MKIGHAKFWTEENIKHLQKIAKASKINKYKHLKWKMGIIDEYESWQELGKPDTLTLSKNWTKYKKYLDGYCVRAGCWKKRDSKALYCSKCRPIVSAEASKRPKKNQYYYYKTTLINNKYTVESFIENIPHKILVKCIVDNIHMLPLDVRKKLLGKTYETVIKELLAMNK